MVISSQRNTARYNYQLAAGPHHLAASGHILIFMSNLIILGAQWGDEGKGKLVDILADRFDYIIRYQGGNNAGHTIWIGERKFVLRLVPSGILHPGKTAVIGNGLVVDPIGLFEEVEALNAAGIDAEKQLRISNRAQVLFPSHRMVEKISELRADANRNYAEGDRAVLRG